MTDEMSLAVFDPIKAELAKLQEKDTNLVFDHTTAEGEKDLRSYVRRLRGHKGDIAAIHKETKAGALTFGRAVDTMKNELTAGVQKIIDARMKPLDDIEAAKRKAAEAAVEAERVAAEKAEQERIADLKRREAEVAAKEAELKAAEDAAKVEANKAAAVKEAVALGERNTQAAIEAERENTRQAKAAEEATARLKKQQAEQAEKRRVENEAHRENVETEIFDELTTLLEDSQKATDVLQHLKSGFVPHVTINY